MESSPRTSRADTTNSRTAIETDPLIAVSSPPPTPPSRLLFRHLQHQDHDTTTTTTTITTTSRTKTILPHLLPRPSNFLPFLTWLPSYQWRTTFHGDLIAALTVASLYIPMSVSFSLLGQVNPLSGLLAFVIHPFIYALFGSCQQMIVGPEATGSLLVGAAVSQFAATATARGSLSNEEIAGAVTALAGLVMLLASLLRLGFLDDVLNRPFMQGFICGVGLVLIVEQAVPLLGLSGAAEELGVAHSSAVIKFGFLVSNLGRIHVLTAAIGVSSLAFIMLVRTAQHRLKDKYPSIITIPDRLIAIVVTTILSSSLHLENHGLAIVGTISTTSSASSSSSSSISIPLTIRWPIPSFAVAESLLGTAILAALLGFFESSVTAKSLRSPPPKQASLSASSSSPSSSSSSASTTVDPGITSSTSTPRPHANQELLALGLANFLGGFFTTLPAFGGFGRSKLSRQTGGSTPLSSLLLSLISFLCVLCLLPYLYHVPKTTLSAMAMAVGIAMVEEIPSDVRFFWKVRGVKELALMGIMVLFTVGVSMVTGVVVGGALVLVQLLSHATRAAAVCVDLAAAAAAAAAARETEFESLPVEADEHDVSNVAIVTLHGHLTFANASHLRQRLSPPAATRASRDEYYRCP